MSDVRYLKMYILYSLEKRCICLRYEMRLRHINYVITRPAISFILLYGALFPSRITPRAIPPVSVTLYDEGLPRVAGFFSVTVKMDFFHRQGKLVSQRQTHKTRNRGEHSRVRRSWGSRGRTQRSSIVEKIGEKEYI